MTNTKKINSKRKGRNGELEVANLLKRHGYDARRGQQYCGANGDADVVGLPGTHIEVKRTERLNINKAMRQAEDDKRYGEIPVVFHRSNAEQWKVTMWASDWIRMYRRANDEKDI